MMVLFFFLWLFLLTNKSFFVQEIYKDFFCLNLCLFLLIFILSPFLLVCNSMIGLFVFPQTEIRGRFLSHNRTTHFAFSPFFLLFFLFSRFFLYFKKQFLIAQQGHWYIREIDLFLFFSFFLCFFVCLEIVSNCTTELYTFPFTHV